MLRQPVALLKIKATLASQIHGQSIRFGDVEIDFERPDVGRLPPDRFPS